MGNFLMDETSPYLLQHAENPVNWYPWCEEAFRKERYQLHLDDKVLTSWNRRQKQLYP